MISNIEKVKFQDPHIHVYMRACVHTHLCMWPFRLRLRLEQIRPQTIVPTSTLNSALGVGFGVSGLAWAKAAAQARLPGRMPHGLVQRALNPPLGGGRAQARLPGQPWTRISCNVTSELVVPPRAHPEALTTSWIATRRL